MGQSRKSSVSIVAVDGRTVSNVGVTKADLIVNGVKFSRECLVLPELPLSFEVVIGMDILSCFEGLKITSGRVELLNPTVSAPAVPRPRCVIEDPDFTAELTAQGHWEVSYKLKQDPGLTGGIPHYGIRDEAVQDKFDKEIEQWIAEGILVPCPDQKSDGILPLMAIPEPAKNKVRPVVDCRNLNKEVESHTADADVCAETIREWRRMGRKLAVVDLAKAYLQIRVKSELWQYQRVKHKGTVFCLTRLAFGLNVAPKIMSRIVNHVLGLKKEIRAGTCSYIDDICVNTSKVDVTEVVRHLEAHGLMSKKPELLGESESVRMLGLKVRKTGEKLFWRRSGEVPEVKPDLTKRELFAACGELVGIYPVGGWLRTSCSYLKRESSQSGWDDVLPDHVQRNYADLLRRVRQDDPSKGRFDVLGDEAVLWSDASSLAYGVRVEVGGEVIEDGAWLRRKDDTTHINVAELEAVIKGLGLCVSWHMKRITVKCDNQAVVYWIRAMLTNEHIRPKGMSEIIVKRRLNIIRDIINDHGLSVELNYVQSQVNKADILTRVKSSWEKKEVGVVPPERIREVHERIGHRGVDVTLRAMQLAGQDCGREDVKKVLDACPQCRSIDPAPVHWPEGSLETPTDWQRVAVDTTHVGKDLYLTFTDCGPSRFTVWRKIRSESGYEVGSQVESLFAEHGPPQELLLDNSAAFHSRMLEQLCDDWNVYRRFRAAFRPSGNGIAERVHRTVKVMASRSRYGIQKAVYYYNLVQSPGADQYDEIPGITTTHATPIQTEDNSSGYVEGQRVYVKPGVGRCTAQWREAVVTDPNAGPLTVGVNGTPRHIGDIREFPFGN